MICHNADIKKIILLTGSLFLGMISFAQSTFDMWFDQKKTQIKELEAQIAELQVYITDLEKGYKIAQQGLQTINDIKHGDFNLHSAYFTSLLSINPAIGGSSTVADCSTLEVGIAAQAQQLLTQLNGSSAFTAKDKAYVTLVIQSLQSRATADAADVNNLTTGASYSLHDQERQQRLEVLHADLASQYSFIRHFSAQVNLTGAGRQQDQLDAQSMEFIYSLP